MTDIQRAISLLTAGVSCVFVKGDVMIRSCERGIVPVLTPLEEGSDLCGFSVADRIVGKAAALLFVNAGIVAVHAAVLSMPGKRVLEDHGIAVSYDVLTDHIVNRQNNGMCPMEAAVLSIDDSAEAYAVLRRRVHGAG